MNALRLPRGLKAAQLKHAAFLMGLPSTGVKSTLESVVEDHLNGPMALGQPSKVVSIDMGIKNMGLCAMEIPAIQDVRNSNTKKQPKLKVLDWKKMDVLAAMRIDAGFQTPKTEHELLNKAAFTPAALSKTAIFLVSSILHTYNPDHILIERQRFRSGGAAAVQEWTLRVNMLESMLWSSLVTLMSVREARTSYSIQEVVPARVAKFWCTGASTSVPDDLLSRNGFRTELSPAGRTTMKVTKQDKIAVVKSWLDPDEGQPASPLEFVGEAAKTAQSFVAATKGGRKPKNVDGKVDDLADCLLQGTAWTQWEKNRHQISEMILDKGDKTEE